MNVRMIMSLIALAPLTGPAADLTHATFSQVINQVSVVVAATKTIAKAKVQDLLNAPDLVQTGPGSLAELVAPDKTITRIGANTVFSFAQRGRSISLERGSVLFHSPRGQGGGIIRTKAASASVLGTTLVVVTTVDAGFKAVVLEGRGEIKLPNGDFRVLNAGQVVFVLPGAGQFGPTLNINLEKLVEGSKLVQGFEEELPSKPKIVEAVDQQKQQIASGRLEDTGLLVGQKATTEEVQVVKSEFLEKAVSTADRLNTVRQTDAFITTPNLDSQFVFNEPFIFTAGGLSRSSFKGFTARNIEVSTTAINLTPYLAGGEFSILADAVLRITGPGLSFFSSGATVPASFELTVGGRTGVDIAANTGIVASQVGRLYLASGSTLSLQNVSINNPDGGLNVSAAGDLTVNGGTYTAGSSHFVRMASSADLTVNNATFVSAFPMLAASRALTVNGATFTGAGTIALDARTVNLLNINFANGTTVNLRSHLGQLAPSPNTGAPSVPGHVNFIQNVNYNNQPAQFFVGSTINISTLP